MHAKKTTFNIFKKYNNSLGITKDNYCLVKYLRLCIKKKNSQQRNK